ncbi:hypothetical protein [Antarctobacter sp.]|uniref:hypothetical protein n=1 Tax=Antarctobacter sp. TaxID=1872577 RepID=UPI003A8FF1F8
MTYSAHRRYPLQGRKDLLVAAASRFAPDTVIADLSDQARLGLRGSGTPQWCSQNRLPFPEAINGVSEADGLRLARLGRYELLILADETGVFPRDFGALPPRTYSAYRGETWGWFRIAGAGAMDLFSAMTSTPLEATALTGKTVLQTTLCGVDAVVLARQTGHAFAADILLDIASSHSFIEGCLSL